MKYSQAQILGAILSISIIVFVMSFPFAIPYKVSVAFILGFLVYAFFEYCFLEDLRLTIKLKSFGLKSGHISYVIILIYGLCLALAMLPVQIPDSSFYLSWAADSLNIAKLLASILLTSFLSGYALLNVVLRVQEKKYFSNLGIGVLSVITSFAITSMTMFFHWVVKGDYNSLNSTLFLSYVFFLVLFVASLLIRQKKLCERTETGVTIGSVSFYKNMVLISIIAYLIWMFLSTHFAPGTLNILYDEFEHVGLTVQLSKGWQSWQSVQTGSGIYPYFLHLVFLATASMSSFPILNVCVSFFFLLILPAFAFYFMARMIFENESDIPLLATVIFSVFAGFGWVYACFLQGSTVGASEISTIVQASQATYDVIRSSWLPIYIAPYAVDLSIFFVLIGLMCCKQIHVKTLSFLVILFVTLGSFVHVEKIVILAFLLLFLSLLHSVKIGRFMNHPKAVLSSYVTGLGIVLVLDFLAPQKLARDYFSMIWYALLMCIVGLVLVVTSDRFRIKMPHLPLEIDRRHLKSTAAYIALGSYVILSVAFFYSYSSYNFNEQTVPLWFLPLKTGVVGILFIVGLFYSAQEKSKITPCLILCAGTLLMQLLLYHLPFSLISPNFPEFRVIRDVLWAFLSLIAAYSVRKLLGTFEMNVFLKRKIVRRILLLLLILMIFVSAVPSHLLKVEYFASGQQTISMEEMDALRYLSTLKIPSGSYVLTGYSTSKVHAVTGIPALNLGDPIFAPLIFESKSAGTSLWTLYYMNVSYIYLTAQDLQFLKYSYKDSFFTWLTQYLPLLFRNNAATIYKVPFFSPPLDDRSVSVVEADLSIYAASLTKNFIWIDDDFSENWGESAVSGADSWSFTTDGDIATMEAKTISGQQAAVFYTSDLNQWIPTSNETLAIVNFKSDSVTSYAILDILYSDESIQRFYFENEEYMISLEWSKVSTFLQPNKLVKAIRIGITDDREGNGKTISCSFDYVAITKVDNPADYFSSALLAALMQINYSTTSEFDSSSLHRNILFVPDLDFDDTRTSKYIEWIRNGGTLVTINSEGQRGAFSEFLGITENCNYILANSIVDNSGSYTRTPEISVPNLQLSNDSVNIIAHYAFGNVTVSPFALLRNFGDGKIIYLETGPIFRKLAESLELVETVGWIKDLLQNYVSLSFFNSVSYRRVFYVKNVGKIYSQGKTNVTTPSVVTGLSKLSGVSLRFSNYSQYGSLVSILQNLTVLNVEPMGEIPVSMYINGNATIYPLDSNNYVKLQLNGEVFFEFDISLDSRVKVTTKDDDHPAMVFCDGVLLLNITHMKDTELIVSEPTIISRGAVTFNSLFASYPYEFQSAGNHGEFNGYATFKVELSGEAVLLLNEVQLDGSLRLDAISSTFINDLYFFMNFPQESAFFTLIVILFIICIHMGTRRTKTRDS